MYKLKKNNALFICSNILYFLTILFTYIDLQKYKIWDTVYPSQFSLITYVIVVLFLVSLFFLLNKVSNDQFKILNFFIYYLILSSGTYILNFPLMDELILITSSIFFLFVIFINRIYTLHKSYFFALLIFLILFIQSIIGFLYDLRSVRYFVIFLCLIIVTIYFSQPIKMNDEKHQIFLNYIFYAIILYVIYQFFFWFLKFYIFEMKFIEQKFIGNMQPSYAGSSSGHFDAIHILSGFLILYYSYKSEKLFKRVILFISIIFFWIMADARSSLFLLIIISFFYFLIIKKHVKFVFIIVFLLTILQANYFDNNFNKYLKKVYNQTSRILNFQTGTSIKAGVYKMDDGGFFYDKKEHATYGDFGRLSYALSGIYSIKHNVMTFFGCGFYSYHFCAKDALIEVYEKSDVPLNTDINRGLGNRPLRPPAAGTILVENGFLTVFIIILYYLRSVKRNIFTVKQKSFDHSKIIISLYFFCIIVSWTAFSNLLDIVFFYMFLLPIFTRFLFYKL